MRILLAGGMPDAEAMLRALAHANDHKITHCADGAYAIAELLKHGYDWAIINSRAVSGGGKDAACLIRSMGPDIRGNSHVSRHTEAKAATHTRRTSCGVEWSKDGVLQLHCAMHALMKDAATPWRPDPGCAGEILFEYHAPCAKARRRDG